jgi:hypothetical protein
MLRFGLPVLMLFAGAVSQLCADTITTLTTADGQGGDAYIWGPSPEAQGGATDSNYGQNSLLYVKNDLGPMFSNTCKSYIRFDLGTVTGPLVDATLDLTSGGGGINYDPPEIYTFYVWGLNDGHGGESWVEGENETGVTGATPPNPITWDNGPAHDKSGGGVYGSETSFVDSFTIANSGAYGEKITISHGNLLSFIEADTDDQVTFILTRGLVDPYLHNGPPHYFAPKEHSTLAPPTLTLTLSAIPEPSILVGLVGMGIAGFAVYGWRRGRRQIT